MVMVMVLMAIFLVWRRQSRHLYERAGGERSQAIHGSSRHLFGIAETRCARFHAMR
jgi:hypothetical protein